VRFFSVEGQRRRLEFAKLSPARAMTPEEEARYLGGLRAQEPAPGSAVPRAETCRGIVSRRGVIGASQSRAEE
jgi:hypothetical protein